MTRLQEIISLKKKEKMENKVSIKSELEYYKQKMDERFSRTESVLHANKGEVNKVENREDILLDDTVEQVITKMAEGNIGALSVLTRILDVYGMDTILRLNEMNIRGAQVWVGFKDHCNQDLDLFAEELRKRSAFLVKVINEESGSAHLASQYRKSLSGILMDR